MVEPLRHRQTKEAETDMFNLKPPRHISTLPIRVVFGILPHARLVGNPEIRLCRKAQLFRRGGNALPPKLRETLRSFLLALE